MGPRVVGRPARAPPRAGRRAPPRAATRLSGARAGARPRGAPAPDRRAVDHAHPIGARGSEGAADHPRPMSTTTCSPPRLREVHALADEGLQVGCVAALADVEATERALSAEGVAYGVAERDGLGKPVTVLSAPEAKGLEFDAVVVVEPAIDRGRQRAWTPPALRRAHPPDPAPLDRARAATARRARRPPPEPERRGREGDRAYAGVATSGSVGAMTVPGPRSSAASSGSPPCAGQ